ALAGATVGGRPPAPVAATAAGGPSGKVGVGTGRYGSVARVSEPPCGSGAELGAAAAPPPTRTVRPGPPRSTSTRSPATSIATAVFTAISREYGYGCWRTWSWNPGPAAATNSPAAWKS